MDPQAALNGFIMLLLNCPSTRRRVDLLGQGVTRDRVNLTTLLTLPIPRPRVDEQVRIIEAADAMDALIRAEEVEALKLDSIRRALMADVLTGRVRVRA